MQFDIYTLIFAGLAIFVIIKLKSVLGTRTGTEKPPIDPFKPQDKPGMGAGGKAINGRETGVDNVIPMPRAGEKLGYAENEPPAYRWAGIAPEGSELANGLDQIARSDDNFDVATFQSGAKAAYEWIVTAFAKGDRKALKDLLSKDVYDSFSSVIAGREQRGETAETTFVSIDKTELTHAEIRNAQVLLTVRFLSKIITATRDKSGTVIEGNPGEVIDVTDIWTFAREVKSRDPNWKLVSTQTS